MEWFIPLPNIPLPSNRLSFLATKKSSAFGKDLSQGKHFIDRGDPWFGLEELKFFSHQNAVARLALRASVHRSAMNATRFVTGIASLVGRGCAHQR